MSGCGIFGTTSPTSAKAVIVEEQIYPFFTPAPVDRFMVYEVTLARLSPVPLTVEPSNDGDSLTATSGELTNVDARLPIVVTEKLRR